MIKVFVNNFRLVMAEDNMILVDKETGNVIVSSVNGENLADCGGKIRIILKKFI